jgi:hypothetical protein
LIQEICRVRFDWRGCEESLFRPQRGSEGFHSHCSLQTEILITRRENPAGKASNNHWILREHDLGRSPKLLDVDSHSAGDALPPQSPQSRGCDQVRIMGLRDSRHRYRQWLCDTRRAYKLRAARYPKGQHQPRLRRRQDGRNNLRV